MTGVHLNKLPAGAIIHRRWEIHSKLGSGGYGIVFKATNPTRKLTVALKLGRLGVDGTTFALKMEAEVLRRLQGLPHTCRFYGFGETGNFAYVAMELLGPSLAELQRNRKRLGVSTGIRVGRQCLAAIQAVHRIGFLHRDIKPANFAVGRGSRNRQVFIVDFGLARCYVKPDLSGLRSPRRYGRFLGTDDYASVRAHRRQVSITVVMRLPSLICHF